MPVHTPAGRGRPEEKTSGERSRGCNYSDTQISFGSGEVVAHNLQKQQRVAPSGIPAGITASGAVAQRPRRAASGDPLRAVFVTPDSVLAVSALHRELTLSFAAAPFTGLLLKIKKRAMLLSLCAPRPWS